MELPRSVWGSRIYSFFFHFFFFLGSYEHLRSVWGLPVCLRPAVTNPSQVQLLVLSTSRRHVPFPIEGLGIEF